MLNVINVVVNILVLIQCVQKGFRGTKFQIRKKPKYAIFMGAFIYVTVPLNMVILGHSQTDPVLVLTRHEVKIVAPESSVQTQCSLILDSVVSHMAVSSTSVHHHLPGCKFYRWKTRYSKVKYCERG